MARLDNGKSRNNLLNARYDYTINRFFPKSLRPEWEILDGRSVDIERIVESFVRLELEHQAEIDQLMRDHNMLIADNLNLHGEIRELREHLNYLQQAVLQVNADNSLMRKSLMKTNSLVKNNAANRRPNDDRVVA